MTLHKPKIQQFCMIRHKVSHGWHRHRNRPSMQSYDENIRKTVNWRIAWGVQLAERASLNLAAVTSHSCPHGRVPLCPDASETRKWRLQTGNVQPTARITGLALRQVICTHHPGLLVIGCLDRRLPACLEWTCPFLLCERLICRESPLPGFSMKQMCSEPRPPICMPSK